MKPTVSLLSSFSAIGLSESAEFIRRHRVEFVELYAFMQQDLGELWPKTSAYENQASALLKMAASFGDERTVNHITSRIHDCLHPAKIVAIATFLPEIASAATSKRLVETAQKALLFLVQVAAKLNEMGHPIKVVELVSGSTVDGIWRGRTKNNAETYIVNRVRSNDSLNRLFAGLVPVCRFIVENHYSTKLALELEPGPLFNLCGKESLLKLCQMMNGDESVRNTLGFNLDLPHWCFLAGIDLPWIFSQPLIMDRIAHAHVCDHSSGHFCDAEPYLFHSASDIGPWLRFLSELLTTQKKRKPAVPYSGFISCELECCEHEQHITRALRSMKELVDRYSP